MADDAVGMALGQANEALDTSGIGKNTVEGLQAGMGLAEKQDKLERQKQDMKFAMEQHDMQKHDWLNGQLSAAITENDPTLRSAILDGVEDQFPKIFDGRRPNPALINLIKKSPQFADKMGALIRVRNAIMQNKPEMVKDLDREVLSGMTSADLTETLKSVNGVHASENALLKSLIGQGVAPAAGVGGQNQQQVQGQLNASPKYAAQKVRIEQADERLDIRRDEQASNAGKSFDSHPLLKVRNDALDRINNESALLADPNTPITPSRLFSIATGIPKIIGGAGSNALESATQEQISNMETKFSAFKQKYNLNENDNLSDLRKDAPQVVKYYEDLLKDLKVSIQKSADKYTKSIAKNFAQTKNPKVAAVVKDKIKENSPDVYKQLYGDDQQPSSQAQVQPGKPQAPAIDPAMKSQIKQAIQSRIDQVRKSKEGFLKIGDRIMREQDFKDRYQAETGEKYQE